jgi:hypothetical protein
VNKELLAFKQYQVNGKDIKCPLQWWEKHETMFPTIGFLAHQILRIYSSQIEIKIILYLIGILINLKEWFLQLNNSKKLDKLVVVNKKWLNNPKVGCTSSPLLT